MRSPTLFITTFERARDAVLTRGQRLIYRDRKVNTASWKRWAPKHLVEASFQPDLYAYAVLPDDNDHCATSDTTLRACPNSNLVPFRNMTTEQRANLMRLHEAGVKIWWCMPQESVKSKPPNWTWTPIPKWVDDVAYCSNKPVAVATDAYRAKYPGIAKAWAAEASPKTSSRSFTDDIILTLENDVRFYRECIIAMRRYGLRSTTTESLLIAAARKYLLPSQQRLTEPQLDYLCEYFADRYHDEITKTCSEPHTIVQPGDFMDAPDQDGAQFRTLTPSQQAELKAAHARGETIQLKHATNGWQITDNPMWLNSTRYRLAPTPSFDKDYTEPYAAYRAGQMAEAKPKAKPTQAQKVHVRPSDLPGVWKEEQRVAALPAPIMVAVKSGVKPAMKFPVHCEGYYPHAFLRD